MITVTWQPGAVRGRSVAQTDRLIIESLQMWQKVCGVRFARLKKLKQSTTSREAQLKRVQAEWRAIGDPLFLSDTQGPVEASIFECFSDSQQIVQSRNWIDVFRNMRAEEMSLNRGVGDFIPLSNNPRRIGKNLQLLR